MSRPMPVVSIILLVLQLLAISNSLYMNVYDFSSVISNNSFIYLFYLIFIHASTFRGLYYSASALTQPKTPEEKQLSTNCRQCGHSVYIRDHHCVFVGQCIGKYNFKFFFSYLFFVYLVCANNLTRVYTFYHQIDGGIFEFLSGMNWNFKGRLIWFIVSGLFGIFFTGHMMAYQLYMILNDMTNFEHIKKIKEVKIGALLFIKSIFSSEKRKAMSQQFRRRWNLYFNSKLDFILFEA